MKKIVMLPLDERPCNFDYPQMMPQANYCLTLPPRSLMGEKKKPADTERLAAWLLENIADADACVLSLDTLIYGGIVPSRLHGEEAETLLRRAETVKEIKKRNPRIKLYAFGLIMRCPSYSLSDEEPDYYDLFGEEIHLIGRYRHLEALGKLTKEDKAEFDRIQKKVDPACLKDYTDRRDKNIAVLMHCLTFVKEGAVDYFILPQDDAAVYGFTSMDQIRVRQYLKDNTLHMKTAMYPSADDTGLTLLARAVSELSGVRPKIFVHYASSKGGEVIPWFEDRVIDETIKYHILSVGGQRVYSLGEADMLLAVNVGSCMYHDNDPGYVTSYDIERNLAEFVSYIKYALDMGKIVAIGDVASANGGDVELLRILREEELLLKVHAYAGWNTSSNTLGTTICQGVLYMIGKDDAGNKSFLLHRYFEEVGYMVYARRYVTDNELKKLGLDYFHADGKCGKVAELVKNAIWRYMQENYPRLSECVESIRIQMPWSRMFETDIKLTLKK